MKKIVVILALAAISTVGCKKVTGFDKNEMVFSFSGDIQGSALSEESTRAIASKDGFVEGDSIGVFVVPWKNATTAGTLLGQGNYADNIPFIAGVDAKKFNPSAADKITFPNATTKVDVYAFAMYHKRYNDLGTTPTGATWTVDKNQTTAIAVRKNDLITANTLNVAPTVNAVPLKFKHRLSKVEVAFTTPATYKGEDVNGVAAVYITNTRVEATVNLTDTTKVPTVVAAKDTASISAFQATKKANIGTPATTSYEYEAIVLPQTVTAGLVVARVVLSVGTSKKLVTFDCKSATELKYTVAEKVKLSLTFEVDYALTLGTISMVEWGQTKGVDAVSKRPMQVLFKAKVGIDKAVKAVKAELFVDGRLYSAPVTTTISDSIMRCSYLQNDYHHSTMVTSVKFLDKNSAPVVSTEDTQAKAPWHIPGRPDSYGYSDVTAELSFN